MPESSADRAGEPDLEIVVPGALDGERLDRTLALVSGLTRREVNDVIDSARVRIGRRAVSSRSRKVRAGERLTVEGGLHREATTLAPEEGLDIPVVHADADLLVVDKPAGIVVHPGAGNRSGTLIQALLSRFPDLAEAGGDADRPGVVHRLDKGTSGLLVLARTERARLDLIRQLAGRSMRRQYTGLVSGHVDADAGVVDAPLGRSDVDPTRMRVQAGGRAARTHFEVVEHLAGPPPRTLAQFRLETGRTHQIRVHMASIGHPVVNDGRYGAREPLLEAGRLFLHAGELGFDHPSTGESLSFATPLPVDLLSALATIREIG